MEMFIEPAIGRIKDLINTYISEQYQYQTTDVKGKLEQLKRSLTRIEAVVAVAEKIEIKVPSLLEWLSELKNAVSDVEYVMNIFEYKRPIKKVHHLLEFPSKFKTSAATTIKRLFFADEEVNDLLEVIKKFDSLVIEIPHLTSLLQLHQANQYLAKQPAAADADQVQQLQETTSVPVEPKLFGRNEAEKKLRELPLKSSDESETNLSVLSIVGVGKTALAPVVDPRPKATKDDPLPTIEELKIFGEPFLGRELIACGYSINGTTTCYFKWVRYLEDGSMQYIKGATEPNYLVTADDVDSCLAVEVQPLDDRMREGDLVKVFANEHRRITCDAEMQDEIKQTLSAGQISFEVSLLAIKFLDIWEPVILTIKREGYSIKGPRGVVATEKFKPSTNITIPYGHPTEFCIQDGSEEVQLKTEVESQLRDAIVLTLRLLKKMALEKRKGRKRGLFFHYFD